MLGLSKQSNMASVTVLSMMMPITFESQCFHSIHLMTIWRTGFCSVKRNNERGLYLRSSGHTLANLASSASFSASFLAFLFLSLEFPLFPLFPLELFPLEHRLKSSLLLGLASECTYSTSTLSLSDTDCLGDSGRACAGAIHSELVGCSDPLWASGAAPASSVSAAWTLAIPPVVNRNAFVERRQNFCRGPK